MLPGITSFALTATSSLSIAFSLFISQDFDALKAV